MESQPAKSKIEFNSGAFPVGKEIIFLCVRGHHSLSVYDLVFIG